VSLDEEIFLTVREHVEGGISLRELFEWVFDRELYWAKGHEGGTRLS
jgi:hypothetical protein